MASHDKGLKTWQWLAIVGGAFVSGAVLFSGSKDKKAAVAPAARANSWASGVSHPVVNYPYGVNAAPPPPPNAPPNASPPPKEESYVPDPAASSALTEYFHQAKDAFNARVPEVEGELDLAIGESVQIPVWDSVTAQMVTIMNATREAIEQLEGFKQQAADPQSVQLMEQLVSNMMAFSNDVKQRIVQRWSSVNAGQDLPVWVQEPAA